MVVNRTLVCGVLAVALVATTVMAQEGRRGGRQGGRGGFGGFGGMMGGGMGIAALLRMERVQEELELVEDQVSDINEALAELRPAGRGRGAGGAPGGQRRGGRGEGGAPDFQALAAQAAEREREVRAKVSEILLPHQMDRLDQLVLQARGTQALSDPEVIAKLEITDEQQAQIAGVRQELAASMREAFQGGRGAGGGGQEAIARIAEMRRDMDAKVLAVLTDEQKQTLEEMKGEAFEFPQPQFGAGGRGGRGGDGARRGGRGGRRGN